MALIYWRDSTETVQTGREYPLPVQVRDSLGEEVSPLRRTVESAWVYPSGIGTGAAYADGDAIGQPFYFASLFRAGQQSGRVEVARYLDLDDEGLQVDLHLFRDQPAPTTDNGAFSPTDGDVQKWVGSVSFAAFYNLANNQLSLVSGIGLHVVSDTLGLWGVVVARGALNIAAANLPMFSLVVIPD